MVFLLMNLRGVTVALTMAMRPVRLGFALCLSGWLMTSAALAAPITITFDAGDPIGGLPVGSILSNQYAAVGVIFTPNAFTGGTWATNTDMTIVSSTGPNVGDLGLPSLVSGNVLRSSSGWFFENGDASFVATFSGGITSLSATFAGILDDVNTSTRLFAYNGTTLLTVATALPGAAQQVLTVSSATPITSVIFTPGEFDDYVAVDNITFTPLDVPEPAGLTLLALGVAAAVRWRRR